MFNEHIEKVKEIENKQWDSKMNKNFQCHFWPTFGKQLVSIKSGDSKKYALRERPRSREKPENVTLRL